MAIGDKIADAFCEVSMDTSKLNVQIRTISTQMQKVGKQMNNLGKQMTVAVSAPIAAFAGASTKVFASFDDAMTQSLAIMGDVSDTMRNEMVNAAKKMSSQTTFSSKQAAESYFFLASAGLKAEEAVAALPRVAQFAQAGMFDMAQATDLLTDAQSALGLASGTTQEKMAALTRVSDVLVKANTLANASVQQFSEALTNRAGAALKIVNKSVEEGIAVLAAYADQGVKGAMAGEQLAIVMRNMQTAAIDNESAFRQLNVSVFDANGNMRNMGNIVADLEGATDGLTDKQKKLALATLGFNDRAQASLLTLIGTSNKIKEYEKNLRIAGNTTQEVADEQLKSFSSEMKLLRNQLENAGITIGQILAPAISKLAEIVSKAIRAFEKMSDRGKKATVIIAGLAAAIGPLLLVAGKLANAFNALVPLLPKLAAKLVIVKKTSDATKISLTMLGKAAGIAGAAFAGWQLGRLISQVKIFGTSLDDLTLKMWQNFGIQTKLDDKTKAQADILRALRKRKEAREALTRVAVEGAKKTAETTKKITLLTKEQKRAMKEAAADLKSKLKESISDQAGAVKKLESQHQDAGDAIKDTTDRIKDLQQAIAELADQRKLEAWTEQARKAGAAAKNLEDVAKLSPLERREERRRRRQAQKEQEALDRAIERAEEKAAKRGVTLSKRDKELLKLAEERRKADLAQKNIEGARKAREQKQADNLKKQLQEAVKQRQVAEQQRKDAAASLIVQTDILRELQKQADLNPFANKIVKGMGDVMKTHADKMASLFSGFEFSMKEPDSEKSKKEAAKKDAKEKILQDTLQVLQDLLRTNKSIDKTAKNWAVFA